MAEKKEKWPSKGISKNTGSLEKKQIDPNDWLEELSALSWKVKELDDRVKRIEKHLGLKNPYKKGEI